MSKLFTLDELLLLYTRKFKDVIFEDAGSNMNEPIYYFMANEGKLVRPQLVLASCNMFGGDLEEAMYPAFGIQMFHNFTLVHDDIMDKADIRRGQASVHKKFGLNEAIISGDLMMLYAYDYFGKVKPDHFQEVFKNFNTTANRIIEGQQMDINFEKRIHVRKQEYLQMIEYKTSVLIAESMRIGAIIADTSDEQKQLAYDFGLYTGLSFQIKDDWLDAFGAGDKFGKKIGGDLIQNKKTILFIEAMELADAKTREKIISLLDSEDESEKISEMLNIYRELKVDNIVSRLMSDYFEQSLGCIDKIDVDTDRKQHLINFAHHIHNRDH
ncbi:MAG: polyprenyl synthetase family protein [Flavobacteriaceae bacterium]